LSFQNHSESNLVVLCLEHHDAAHTKKSLSLSLSAEQLRGHEDECLNQVKYDDARAILDIASEEGSRWDYINHNRLMELAAKIGIRPEKHACFSDLQI